MMFANPILNGQGRARFRKALRTAMKQRQAPVALEAAQAKRDRKNERRAAIEAANRNEPRCGSKPERIFPRLK